MPLLYLLEEGYLLKATPDLGEGPQELRTACLLQVVPWIPSPKEEQVCQQAGRGSCHSPRQVTNMTVFLHFSL